ncbi:MAG: cysteine dioxygenase [Phycisphaerales bacterium]
MTLEQLMDRLDQFDERVPLDELVGWLEDLEVTVDELRTYVRFAPDHYQRNLVRNGSAYQALLLCWENGQRSPIHDHEGSSCGLKVLEGVATETIFDRAPNGMIFATHSHEMAAGYVCGSQDADIHQVSNLQPGEGRLITLHVYSPPLNNFNTYSLYDTKVKKFKEPVFEFAGGAGI